MSSSSSTSTTKLPPPAIRRASPSHLRDLTLNLTDAPDIKTPTSPALQSAAASLAMSRSLSEVSLISAAEQAAVANAAITLSRQSAESFQSSRISDVSFNTSASLASQQTASSVALSSSSTDGTEPFPTTEDYSAHTPDDELDAEFDAENTIMGPDGKRMPKRRGYMRPQGTDFAASARHRESVLSLGSIAHIQHYFARTGLLDGKGAQFARKNKHQRATLDMSGLMSPLRSPSLEALDDDGAKTRHLSMMFGGPAEQQIYVDSAMPHRYFEEPLNRSSSSMRRSESRASRTSSNRSDSDDSDGGETSTLYSEDYEDDIDMLPPTVSTFKAAEKHIPPPPTIAELKRDLRAALNAATTALEDALAHKTGGSPRKNSITATTPARVDSQSWYEVQGIHILDVMTMAIRAAKVYYISHEHPERLDSIRPEREVRTELLSVLECLRQMATREFKGGIKETELGVLAGWIAGVSAMLRRDEQLEAKEKAEQQTWAWLNAPASEWEGREIERELAFLHSMCPEAAADIPPYTPLPEDLSTISLPTPFLAAFQNGLKLVQFHNAAVRKSRRRFGAIAAYHKDTQKPYRAADNIRFWAKAAELRWELLLKVDALAVVYSARPEAWKEFHTAIFKWCRRVREEITGDLKEEEEGAEAKTEKVEIH